jgi:hypothetical protein
MSENRSKGIVLKFLKTGPIEVLTRVADFNIQEVSGPDGQKAEIPATTLVAFVATRFREVEENSDEWEFATLVKVKEDAPPTTKYIYLSGRDIFMIRADSKVA